MPNQYKPRFLSDTHKECSSCGVVKIYTDFHKDKNSPSGLTYYCKECANSKTREFHTRTYGNKAYMDKKRNSYFKMKYGISLEERLELLKKQNYACAICETLLPETGTHTHIDHCHITGIVRELLCTNCNRGLGHFKDSKDNLLKAIKYLDKHSGNDSASSEGSCL